MRIFMYATKAIPARKCISGKWRGMFLRASGIRPMCVPSFLSAWPAVLEPRPFGLWNPFVQLVKLCQEGGSLPSRGEVEAALWMAGPNCLSEVTGVWKVVLRGALCGWVVDTWAGPGRPGAEPRGEWEDPGRWEVWVPAGTESVLPGGVSGGLLSPARPLGSKYPAVFLLRAGWLSWHHSV